MKSSLNLSTRYPYFFLVLFFTFFAGCAKYKAQHINKKEKTMYLFEEHKNDIVIKIQAFDQEKFKNYLSAYQPIHLHIKNKTINEQELSSNNISLPIATLKELKKKEPKFFFINFIPCILSSILGIFFWWEFVMPAIFVFGSCAWQLSIVQRERAVRFLKNNTFFSTNRLIIPPLSTIDVLIFVKQTDYTPRFSITITTPATNSKNSFNIFITARTTNGYSIC
jgi:hypothetical protein